MLTKAQTKAIREHVAIDERTRELIKLANADLHDGPSAVFDDECDEPYPGFSMACDLIRNSIEVSDLYIDREIDEVIGDVEPHFHGNGCGCDPNDFDTEVVGYYPQTVLKVDAHSVKRALVGAELARYV